MPSDHSGFIIGCFLWASVFLMVMGYLIWEDRTDP